MSIIGKQTIDGKIRWLEGRGWDWHWSRPRPARCAMSPTSNLAAVPPSTAVSVWCQSSCSHLHRARTSEGGGMRGKKRGGCTLLATSRAAARRCAGSQRRPRRRFPPGRVSRERTQRHRRQDSSCRSAIGDKIPLVLLEGCRVELP